MFFFFILSLAVKNPHNDILIHETVSHYLSTGLESIMFSFVFWGVLTVFQRVMGINRGVADNEKVLTITR